MDCAEAAREHVLTDRPAASRSEVALDVAHIGGWHRDFDVHEGFEQNGLGLHEGLSEDMASGDVLFAATGVTDGNLLDGVRFNHGLASTHTLVTRSHTGTQRWVRAQHRIGEKFGFID